MSSPATRHTENVSLLDTLACSIVLHAYLRRGCSGWLPALPSLLLPLHGPDVSMEPEVVVEAGGWVQVVSGESLQLCFTDISGARGGGGEEVGWVLVGRVTC